MLHQEVRTYTLNEKSHGSALYSLKQMEELYRLSIGQPAVPHRHDYYNIYFIEEGEGTHTIDFNEYAITPRQLYFLMPDQMHRLDLTSPTKGYIFSFTEAFVIANSIPDYLMNDIYLFNNYGQSPPLPINESSLPVYQSLFVQIQTFAASLEKYALEAIGALVKLLLIQCNNHCSLHKTDNPQFMETSNHLLRGFKQLLNKHYESSHKVNEYAERLSVTPDYLNKTIKSITGKSAKDHIQGKLITEAKRFLIFSNLSNKELAYTLGFEESAHFNNFFKKNTGLTPSEFKVSVLNP